jgi:hypothetical protein
MGGLAGAATPVHRRATFSTIQCRCCLLRSGIVCQLALQDERGGLGAVVRTQFRQDGFDVMADGLGLIPNSAATSASLRPAARRSSTSRSRRVNPCGSARVSGRGAHGSRAFSSGRDQSIACR